MIHSPVPGMSGYLGYEGDGLQQIVDQETIMPTNGCPTYLHVLSQGPFPLSYTTVAPSSDQNKNHLTPLIESSESESLN